MGTRSPAAGAARPRPRLASLKRPLPLATTVASPPELIRLVLGSLLVLVLPGLAWSFVFFPRTRRLDATKEAAGIDWIERGALAVGLSIVIVPVAAFLLNYFLKMPLNTLTATLLAIVLSAAPAAYVWAERTGRLPRRRPGPAPPTKP